MKEEQPITSAMTIGQIIEKFPQTSDLMLGYGLHCVGCSVNPYETIEQGALGHGMDEEQIKHMVEDLNLVITKKPSFALNAEGITISPRALEVLEIMRETEKKIGFGLKIRAEKVQGELDYFLDLVKEAAPDEVAIKEQVLPIFIDKASLEMMKPSIVEYTQTLQGEGFKIIPLREKDCCGGKGKNCKCSPGEAEKGAPKTGCGCSTAKDEHGHGVAKAGVCC